MDFSILIQALQLVAYFSLFIFAALLLGSVFASLLRVLMQIDDQLVNFTCKFIALVICLYFGAEYFSRELSSFTKIVWGEESYYF